MKKMFLKRIGAIVLILALLSSLSMVCLGASEPYNITGTWMDPVNWEEITPIEKNYGVSYTYQVENARQFAWVMNQLYQGKLGQTGVAVIQLTGDDIDLGEKLWFPGGYNEEIKITGKISIQGENRTVNGMMIGTKENPVQMKFVGLFPYLNETNLTPSYAYTTSYGCQNLGVTNAAVYAKDCVYAGILSGFCTAKMNCCFVTGTIDITGGGTVGGLGGMISYQWTNCYTDCSINADQAVAGGLFGYADNYCSIWNCYSNSTVSGPYAGAFAGKTFHTSDFYVYTETALHNCYYNSENNPDLPAIYDMATNVSNLIPEFSGKLTRKTLAEMQTEDFVTALNTIDSGYKKLIYPGFSKDSYNANKGLPVILNSQLKNKSTYKKYASVSLPENKAVGDIVSIPRSGPSRSTTRWTQKADDKQHNLHRPINLTKSCRLYILAVRAAAVLLPEAGLYRPALPTSKTTPPMTASVMR
jgi:hypothetical protein